MKPIIRRFYTPVVCLLGLFLLNYLVKPLMFDPRTVAQDPRLTFQTDNEETDDSVLDDEQRRLSQAVLEPDFSNDPEALQILYLSNSQSMAIMDRSPGDLIGAQWLQIFLASEKERQQKVPEIRLGSLPNLTMSEFLVKLVAAGERSPRQIDVVVGGIVLEEWRGASIRDELLPVTRVPEVNEVLSKLSDNNPDLSLASHLIDSFGNESTGDKPTTSEPAEHTQKLFVHELEVRLQDRADQMSSLFAMRSQLYGMVAVAYYNLRNRVLGISTSSARPVPTAAYRTSLETLELTLRYAQSKGIHVVLYLAPIRPIQPNPNLPEDVSRFRKDSINICEKYNVTCFDYTSLIPEELWTKYSDTASGLVGQLDYAHFTGAAHKRLAEQLFIDTGPAITTWAVEK